MSKPLKRRGNPDFHRFVSPPSIPIAAIEQEIISLLTPGTFATLKSVQDDEGRQLRDRTLTLSVMSALVISLVYRQVRYLSEIVRLLEQEGLLWCAATKVSKQAVSERLSVLPASLFLAMFNQVSERIRARPMPAVNASWRGVQQRFGAVWMADGSTMARLEKRLARTQVPGSNPLAGKLMMVVEAFTHRPVQAWYHEDAQISDVRWQDSLAELLPTGGLLIVDMGFFAFPFFDALSAAAKFYLTRLKSNVRYEVVRTLSSGPNYRDEMVRLGLYRANPCHSAARLVSVRWGTQWHHYLTNVTDPEMLSPKQVCELYRQRWTIETAFLLTKRLLGLAYFWVGGKNGVAIQIYATWIFYAVLNDLCADVAVALSQPIEQISVEMVFRSLYHYARALAKDPELQLIPFFVKFHKSFGLIKASKKRDRKKVAWSLDLWKVSLT